ncbi:MAG: hypothetical protein JNL32_01200 [Candidatus Kapabacteria bacterium]|nr:hypothetical protein [Candidatus Kapabacteria bacterium]
MMFPNALPATNVPTHSPAHAKPSPAEQWFDWLISLNTAVDAARSNYKPHGAAKLRAWADLLVRSNYTREQASTAWLWCTAGSWFDAKREMQFSDLFPNAKQLLELRHGLMTVTLHNNRLRAMKDAHERELHAVAVHYERKMREANPTADPLPEIIDFGRQILDLKDEIHERDVTIMRLCKEIERLRRTEPIPEQVTDSSETYSRGLAVEQNGSSSHSSTMYHNELVTQTGAGNDR